MKVLSNFFLSLSQQLTLAYTLEKDKEGYLVNYPREVIVISLVSSNSFSVELSFFILFYFGIKLIYYVVLVSSS